MRKLWVVFAGAVAIVLSTSVDAQVPAGCAPNTLNIPGAPFPCIYPDGRVTFRVSAPDAQKVRVRMGQGFETTKGADGLWSVTTTPLVEGFHYYTLAIDGSNVADPATRTFFGSGFYNSAIEVPARDADIYAAKDVPHGQVRQLSYFSKVTGQWRRAFVYTPPDYDIRTSAKYPVFYLLHGAGDSDDSWSTVGRAGFILDNLIAAKKARPMVVVMPAGHVRATPGAPAPAAGTDAFVSDFTTDIMPLVQKNYRVSTDRASTAIAGLSMGGSQTLNIAIPNLEKFGYIGVYSSGLLGAFPAAGRGGAAQGRGGAAPAAPAAATNGATEWETRYAAKLDDANLKKGLKVFWFATGKDDFLIGTTTSSVDLFKKHGFTPVFKESLGGHTWMNWRDYLNEFAPMLF